MVANVIYDCSSPFDFAIVLLQLLEEIVGSVEQWKDDRKMATNASSSISTPQRPMNTHDYMFGGAADILGTSIARSKGCFPRNAKCYTLSQFLEPI